VDDPAVITGTFEQHVVSNGYRICIPDVLHTEVSFQPATYLLFATLDDMPAARCLNDQTFFQTDG
jgi:hypothetical protein